MNFITSVIVTYNQFTKYQQESVLIVLLGIIAFLIVLLYVIIFCSCSSETSSYIKQKPKNKNHQHRYSEGDAQKQEEGQGNIFSKVNSVNGRFYDDSTDRSKKQQNINHVHNTLLSNNGFSNGRICSPEGDDAPRLKKPPCETPLSPKSNYTAFEHLIQAPQFWLRAAQNQYWVSLGMSKTTKFRGTVT